MAGKKQKEKEKEKEMKKASSQSKPSTSSNRDDRGKALLDDPHESADYFPTDHIQCLTLQRELGERSSWRRYRLWRQERNQRSARLERQLKALEDRIDKQLRRFQAQYSRAMNPTQPKDVAELLVPKSTPPLELATLSWLGDWRPSSILGLLSSLIKSSPTLASSLSHAGATEKAISQLIHDLRIEEAVIDEEMTEIQANCILRLPFNLSKEKSSNTTLAQVQSELKKVHRLIIKAQNFRTNALEMVVKKILCQSDAAEFLVAFAGIQETVHQFSKDYKLRKGPVCVSLSSGSEIVKVDSCHSISKFL